MNRRAPIAIVIFRRPEHLRATLQSLLDCPESADSDIYVFGDGPRDEAERAPVEAARAVARELLGNRAHYRFSDINRGLSRSVIGAVDELTRSHGRVILLEDDLQLSPDTLAYLNAALDRYAEDERVMQVSAYMFDVPELRDQGESLFLPLTTSWGWATWQRAWSRFDPAATGWEAMTRDRELRRRFNLDDAYDYATMLERQMAGLRDSWAVRWYWSVFRAGGLVVYPPRSMVRNAGLDGSGTHGRGLMRKFADQNAAPSSARLPQLQSDVSVRAEYQRAVSRTIRRQNGGGFGRVVNLLRRAVGR